MEIYILILKTIISIIVLFSITKIMGRKQISQLNVFDFALGITMGNIAAEMAINKDVKLLSGILAMIIYALISIFVSFLTSKSIKARRFFNGVPIVVLENGKLIEESLKKIKFDVNDLLEECRVKGYFDLSEIEFAIMEANGEISFLPKSKYAPLTPNDMKIKTKYKGLSSNLVIDGNIMDNNLKTIGKDRKWLMKQLKSKGYKEINSLLLVTCDTNEKVTIYEKNKGVYSYQILE